MLRSSGRVLVACGLVAVLGAACSDDATGPDIGASPSAAAPSTSTSASASGYASAAPSETASALPVPAGVELTDQGSQLTVGEPATVAYQPNQKQVGVLDITVTRLEATSFAKSFAGWQLTAEQKKAKPYFVRATLTNRGDTDLGGRRVPLYVVDGANTLVESTTFASAFKACEPGSFPESFPPGASVETCSVYLVPNGGDLTAVSFRPTQEVDPITWTGPLEKPKKSGKGKNKG